MGVACIFHEVRNKEKMIKWRIEGASRQHISFNFRGGEGITLVVISLNSLLGSKVAESVVRLEHNCHIPPCCHT